MRNSPETIGNIVIIAGGNGGKTTARAANGITEADQTAIFPSSDGGSSAGRAIRMLNGTSMRDDGEPTAVPAVGDVREILVGSMTEEMAEVFEPIFSHRFPSNLPEEMQSLVGLSVNELMIAAATAVEGDIDNGIERLRRGFGVRSELLKPQQVDLRDAIIGSLCMDLADSFGPVLDYRFLEGNPGVSTNLAGHAAGNLLIAATLGVDDNLEAGVDRLRRGFGITRKLIPASNEHQVLVARLANGTTWYGEDAIDSLEMDFRGTDISFLGGKILNQSAQNELKKADTIFIGPGSTITSLGAVAAKEGFYENVWEGKRVVQIINLLTDRSSPGWAPHDYVRQFNRNAGGPVITDILFNTRAFSPELLEQYANAKPGQYPVMFDREGMDDLNRELPRPIRIIGLPLASMVTLERDPNDPIGHKRTKAVHDTNILQDAMREIFLESVAA